MVDWLFWAVAGALALIVGATLLRAVRRKDGGAGASCDQDDAAKTPARAESYAHDIRVYRDQLSEIEADVARGTLPEDEAERLRIEVSRRLLAADGAQLKVERQAPVPGGARAGVIGAACVLAMLCASFALYRVLGAPGYLDAPLNARLAAAQERYETRISQSSAEARIPKTPVLGTVDPSFLALMTKLRATMKDNAHDPRGWALLARNEAALGNMRAAIEAQTQLITLKGAAASAEDYASLAEMMIFAAGGYVSPDAEKALRTALSQDESNGTARYYLGEMFAQIGRFDRTLALWRALLSDKASAESPWRAPILERIAEVAARAGVNYTPPEESVRVTGPTQEDIAAAQDLSDDERRAMIAGMVAQLGARLANEGGSAEEWARLMTSLALIGRTDDARDVYAEARMRFSDAESALSALDLAAQRAGIAR